MTETVMTEIQAEEEAEIMNEREDLNQEGLKMKRITREETRKKDGKLNWQKTTLLEDP